MVWYGILFNTYQNIHVLTVCKMLQGEELVLCCAGLFEWVCVIDCTYI